MMSTHNNENHINSTFEEMTLPTSYNNYSMTPPTSYNNYYRLILMATTGLGVLSSVLSLLYIFFKLTLNKYIKTILLIMGFHNLISFSIMTVAIAVIIENNMEAPLTCMLLTQPQMFVMKSNRMLICLISAIRYLMAYQASKVKIMSTKYIISLITLGATLPYLTMIANWSVSLNKDNLLTLCLDSQNSQETQNSQGSQNSQDSQDSLHFQDSLDSLHSQDSQNFQHSSFIQFPMQFALNISLALLSISIGLFFDFKMLGFVRKRRQIQPIPTVPSSRRPNTRNLQLQPNTSTIGLFLVPWKSSSSHQEQKDIGVPLNATIISFSYLLVFTALSLILSFWFDNFWVIMTTACLIHIPPLPMMLIFTMKKQGKSQIQPPKALQFHNPKRTKKVTISPILQFHEFSEHSTELTQLPNAIKEEPAKTQNQDNIEELNVKKLSELKFV